MAKSLARSEFIFDSSANLTHEPEGDASWQESSVFAWNDLENGVSGFWRLGQEPVIGALSSSFGVCTIDGQRFRHNVSGVPMVEGDRSLTHMSHGDKLRVDLDTLSVTVNFAECQAQLQFTDFLPLFDYLNQVKTGGGRGEIGHHIEMPGRLKGTMRIGDREIKLDALAHRDRSWGLRDWSRVRATRWWPCVFGPDLFLHMLTVVDTNPVVMKVGYLYRDGVMKRIADLDCLVTIDADGVSARSASGHIVLEDGVELEIAFTPHDSFMMFVRGFSATETMGTVWLGDRVGMSHLEICTNPSGGHNPVSVAVSANNVDGLTRK